jgi:aminoglycoside phosphotransferase (APT) family kinase protein
MLIDKEEFKKIDSFLKKNQFNLLNQLPKKIGNGQSNPTYILLDENGDRFILRTQPKGELVRGAHRLDREFHVLSGLSKNEFSVPKPLILCEDKSIIGRDFYIMEYIDGHIYEDPFLPNNSPQERRKIYESLAMTLGRLHSYNINKLDIPFKKNTGFMLRNLNIWYSQIFNDDNQDKDISKIYDFIIKNTPENNNLCLIHGDYKLDNLVIGDDSNCLAVLDWELSAFGEPEVDLSFQMINWLIPKGVLYGIGVEWNSYELPSASEFLKSYEESFGEMVNIELLNIYCLFSLTKLYCILKGIENRVKAGNAASEEANEKIKDASGIKAALMLAYENFSNNLIVN